MEKVAKIKAGDGDAFREVFYDYSQKLYNYMYEKTKSAYFANEVVQLTFIKLWRCSHQLNEHVKLSTQLFQIAKTTMIDELRREERYKTKVQHLLTRENLFRQVDGYSPIEAYDVNAQLHRAMEELPPIRRKVFRLGKIEHRTYKEISTELSISVKTVDKHMQLALRNMKPMFKLVAITGIMAMCLFR